MAMTKDEALLMAIEFMKTLTIDVGIKTWNEKRRKEALKACKEALEQPARLVSYAPDKSTCTLNIDGEEVYFNREQPAQEPAYQVGEIVNPYGSNIKIKQPAQEPVAWMYQTEDENFKTDTLSVGYEPTFDGKIIPLYTHPAPSWQGLSDDEIMNIARESYMSRDGGDIKFARAINDKLKEKNYG